MDDFAAQHQDELLQAIMIPPQQERFRAITGIGEEPLQVDVTGWHKHVVLAAVRVFLFPRHSENVSMVEREAAVYAAMVGLPFSLPHLLVRYHDLQVSPYPFIAVNRLQGLRFGAIEAELPLSAWPDFLSALGSLIALWHNLDIENLPAILHEPVAARRAAAKWRDRALNPSTCERSVAELRAMITAYLDQSGEKAAAWAALLSDNTQTVCENALAELARMQLVLTHRDIHEGQLLIADRQSLALTGVLDWETAGVDHPLHDFDFGEWGAGIWRWRSHFVELRRAMWQAYAAARQTPVPHWSRMSLYFCMRQVVWLLDAWAQQKNAPEALGAIQEQLGYLLQSINICGAAQ